MSGGLGAFGESWATGYLTRKGYRITERNVRYRQGEIDIVAYDGGELVFVEVKCRRGRRFGSPEESITAARFARLAGAIQLFLAERALEPESYRVDVLAIEVDARGVVVRGDLLQAVESPAR